MSNQAPPKGSIFTSFAFYKKISRAINEILKRFYHEKVIFRMASKESVFTSIWKNNYWSDDESVSGPGSTLTYTESIREELPKLIKQYSFNNVFDAPCGDFTWMKEVLKEVSVNYIGGDIVKGIVNKNNEVHGGPNISFMVFDITSQTFPKSDLWICRDVLFHLSHKDIVSTLQQFVKSDVPYLLTTTHINHNQFANSNILTGDFRLIDLFAPPYNFPKDVLYRFDDYIDQHPAREMCLFTKVQVAQVVAELNPIFK